MRIQRIFPVALMCVLAVHAEEASSRIQTVVTGQTAAVSQYLVALPHMAFGGAWRTKVIITNTSSSQTDVTLNYFGSTGTPLSVPINGTMVDHSVVTVPGNGEREIEPDWAGPLTAGWVGLDYTSSGIKIQGVFLWHDPNDPADKYTEAAAPVISQVGPACIIPLPGAVVYSMPFDETAGFVSGYGFANTTSSSVAMTLTLYDESGQQLGTYTEQVPGFGHPVFLLTDYFPLAAGKKGRIGISGSGIVPLGFRFTPYYTFTTWQP